MKVKIFALITIGILIVISVAEIFQIYPGPDRILPLYKSGYFSEIDKSNSIIAESFLAIKTLSQPVRGWIFLDDLSQKQHIVIRVYDNEGNLIPSPGEKKERDTSIAELLAVSSSETQTVIEGKKYISRIPFVKKDKCGLCHNRKQIGAMVIIRDYNATSYYTLERRLIFIPLSIFLLIMLLVVARWDPEKRIKEMFDKTL